MVAKRRSRPDEFKRDAVDLVRCSKDRTLTDIPRSLGIPLETLRNTPVTRSFTRTAGRRRLVNSGAHLPSTSDRASVEPGRVSTMPFEARSRPGRTFFLVVGFGPGVGVRTPNTMRWIGSGGRVRSVGSALSGSWGLRRGSCRMTCGSGLSRCCRSGRGGSGTRAASRSRTDRRCAGSCSCYTPAFSGNTCLRSSASGPV